MKIDTINLMHFRKKGVQPMFPWTEQIEMEGVSVSDTDKNNGSPQAGDMIAFNPDKPEDRWLIAEDVVKQTYEQVS